MRKLSAQCDELRTMAGSVGLEMPQAATLMMGAADAIEGLEAENAELKKLIAKYSAAAKYLCGFSHCNECNLDCASVFGDVPSGWDCARMLLDKEARELGVNVLAEVKADE